MEENWHASTEAEILAKLRTDSVHGLDVKEAVRRLEHTGRNELEVQSGPSLVTIFINQFQDLMVLVLAMAAVASYLLGETADALTIIAIVIVNACLGFFQEQRAERSLAALRQLTAPVATVLRSGEEVEVVASEVVPGDILCISEGDRVAADARLLDAHGLEIDEAALTGESLPVTKHTGTVADDTPLAERSGMVYQGTAVTRGRGRAVVVATGMKTEMGRIASLIASSGSEETPLQRRLDRLGRFLLVACLVVAAFVTVAGMLQGEPMYRMLLTGVSLAVAAIPEGLPAIVTIALALGVQRMIRVNAIIRRLPAVETLGCATYICSDKTGIIVYLF